MKADTLKLSQLRLKSQEELSVSAVKEVTNHDIAIIGIHTRFPMATDTAAFWQNILNGVSCVSVFPDQRKQDADQFVNYSEKYKAPIHYLKGSYIEDIDKFDYSFFGIPPKEALLMNPHQRLFLEAAWNVFEDAGYAPLELAGSNVGVYVGHIGDVEGYQYREIIQEIDPSLLPSSIPGNLSSIIPSRISYLLNLKGPSMTVDTACSSSLIAVDLACHALQRGECDMAIAGAVRINLLPEDAEYMKLGIESTDHETRAFDQHADGSGMGEGVAAILLKPLNKAMKDGDPIYCVIKGSASNQDGASMGITAPNPAAQTDVLIKAWKDARIEPASLSYIETHGTGTKLGDPIEVEGISKAFRRYTDKKQFCAIGSVKTNMGHLYDCAGLAGLIKSVLSLKHQVIPPSVHFKSPNNQISFVDSPIYVNIQAKHWESDGTPRRCGVSSFGLSGTNCHVVLEEYVQTSMKTESDDMELKKEWIFPLSAKTETAMLQMIQTYCGYLAADKQDTLHDICYTLSLGRDHYPFRLAVMADSIEDLYAKLRQLNGNQLNEITAPWFSYSGGSRNESFSPVITDVKEIIEKLQSSDSKNRFLLLRELADLYTSGSAIKWSKLFQNRKARKVNIPVYPFDRKRCWLNIPDRSPERSTDVLFYAMDWVEEQSGQPGHTMEGETFLVLGDWTELLQELRADGIICIQVTQGTEFQVVDPQTYVVGDKEEDYYKLLKNIQHLGITKVIHTSLCKQSKEIYSVDDLQETQNKGVYSLFYLTKALLNDRTLDKLDIVLLGDHVNRVTGMETRLKPEIATLFGLGKVIGIEYPHITCRAIDVDDSTSTVEVISELKRKRNTYQIAFRSGKRYAELMKDAEIDQVADRAFEVKEEGVYVITGGTGELGLLIAQHLATKGKVNIALLNRTPLPPSAEWEQILSEDGTNKLKSKLIKLKNILSMGANVEFISVNVSSLSDMNQAMGKLRQKYNKVNGVIHAAGVAGRGFMVRKDREVFEEVLSPKVAGTWVLDRVTEQDNLDFFVLFSSGVALSGEMGQSDYTAANCYLDAFAEYRRKRGKHALSINWVVWEGARMAQGKSETIDGMFKTLPAALGLHAFDKAVGKELARVFVGELNTASQNALEMFSKEAAFYLSEPLRNWINSIKPDTQSSEDKREPYGHVMLLGNDHGEYTEVEQSLAHLYREVLGYEEISVYDSFFELGGDSVQLHRLHKLIDREFQGQTSIADLFAYSSISKLAAFLTRQLGDDHKKNKKVPDPQEKRGNEIAIIGMSGLFPGSDTIEQYWNNIRNGVDCMTPIPDERRAQLDQYLAFTGQDQDSRPGYINCGYLNGIDEFDYQFFRISPKEANLTDPSQRLFMQMAWNAIEDAGYGGNKLRGTRTGVYVGFANVIRDSYQKMLTDIDPAILSEAVVGNVSAMIPSRISHIMDLKGPTMVVDTACSSSLVATHLACNAIKNGDCDTALVGGIKLFLFPLDHDYYKIGIESQDGKTRAFDAHSDGAGVGEGTSVIVLKSLQQAEADGDRIYAVIKGSAINHDGTSIGITAPNPTAQTDVIMRAWENAGVHPESIAFYEAHGTGTELGDPIEISGLKHAVEAYTDKKQFCAMGSVKSNIGHLNEGAGMASIIKVVMAVKHREIPPTMYFQTPNRKIAFHDSPLYINTQVRKWGNGKIPMRSGVSSFGLSGTNCHMIIEEYMEKEQGVVEGGPRNGRYPYIMTISAASIQSLQRLVNAYAVQLSAKTPAVVEDICYTANTGRGHYNHRIAFIVYDMEDLYQKIAKLDELKSYDAFTEDGIYFGSHRVVSDYRSMKHTGDMTESRKNELRHEVEMVVMSMRNSVSYGLHDVEALCQVYTQGGDIPWDEFYKGQKHLKVQLPVYPFEKTKCWVELSPKGKQSEAIESSRSHDTFVMGWKQQKRSSSLMPSSLSGTILIIKDEEGFSERLACRLRALGQQVLEVNLPELPTEQEGPKIESALLEQYKAMFDHGNVEISQIIHCATLNGCRISSIEDLESSQFRGAFSLFLLMKAWGSYEFKHTTEIILLSKYVNQITGDEVELRSEVAPLFGFGKALPREFDNLKCRCMDMDDNISLDDLVSELCTTSEARVVGYRNGIRYVEVFEESSSESATPKRGELTVKEGGVYLITGGMGGIGLETAKWLASKGKVKLVLANRSIMPARDQWDAILSRGEDEKLCNRIRSILEIEAKGSEVMIYRVDVSDPEEVAGMLEKLRLSGELKGIVHAAGVVRTEPILEKSLDAFRETISCKIYGTWILDHMTAEDRLDFFMMYSSVATVFETGFQSDYLAANAYLDAYSSMGSMDDRRRLTINWTTWKDKGMASDNKFQADTIFKTIASDWAIDVLDRIWKTSLSRAVIGELNLESKMVLWINNYQIQISQWIKDRLDIVKLRSTSNAGLKKEPKPKLAFSEESQIEESTSDQIESHVALVCREVLGLEEIDIHEIFFEMGADSLIIRQIYQKLKSLYPGDLLVSDLFEYPTVHKLTCFIKEKLADNSYNSEQSLSKEPASSLEDHLNQIFDELDTGELDVEQALSKIGMKKR